MSDVDDYTQDVGIGIRSSCQFCSWKSDSYPFGTFGEEQAEDELANHQMKDHPRGSDGVRVGIWDDTEV